MPCHLRGMCEGTDSRCATTVTVRGTRLRISGLSGFLCLSFFAAAKKVSAAPHRGNTNIPITNQGKAKNPDQEKAKKPDQKKANAAGKKTAIFIAAPTSYYPASANYNSSGTD